MTDETETTKKPTGPKTGPKTCTKVQGGRSLQYYALRTRWDWQLSEKSRCWTTVMREQWGGDLDAITLLGIEPKPIERDWRRYDEARELVDLGRNHKLALGLIGKLQGTAYTEKSLRHEAGRDTVAEATAALDELIESDQDYQDKFKRELGIGVMNALRHSNCDEAVVAEYLATWAEETKTNLSSPFKSVSELLETAKAKAEERLMSGSEDEPAFDPIGRAAVAYITPALRRWQKKLTVMIQLAVEVEGIQATVKARRLAAHDERLALGLDEVSGAHGAL